MNTEAKIFETNVGGRFLREDQKKTRVELIEGDLIEIPNHPNGQQPKGLTFKVSWSEPNQTYTLLPEPPNPAIAPITISATETPWVISRTKANEDARIYSVVKHANPEIFHETNKRISDVHCFIGLVDCQLILEDAGSMHGTRVFSAAPKIALEDEAKITLSEKQSKIVEPSKQKRHL